jgi:hypothetical protein
LNKYRFKHNAQNIILSDDLSSEAQNYSNYLVKNKIFEDYETTHGQNIEWFITKENGTEAVMNSIDNWYEEKDFLNITLPVYNYGVRDFVHMAWKSTIEVGIGVSYYNEFGTIIFALFHHYGDYYTDLARELEIIPSKCYYICGDQVKETCE